MLLSKMEDLPYTIDQDVIKGSNADTESLK